MQSFPQKEKIQSPFFFFLVKVYFGIISTCRSCKDREFPYALPLMLIPYITGAFENPRCLLALGTGFKAKLLGGLSPFYWIF